MEKMIGTTDGLILCILVLFLGNFLTERIRLLKNYNIPTAVTGGLLCSTVIGLIFWWWDLKISFDMAVRDKLLLAFFTTIGLTAKFRVLKSGGKALGLLVAVAAVFLVVQDVTGVLLVKLLGGHPAYGLFGGSISFAGGYGTAIAWGEVAEKAGLARAQELGIACATFGLIAGSLLGGPIAKRLISLHDLRPADRETTEAESKTDASEEEGTNRINAVPGTLLALGICFEVGDLVNRLLFSTGVMLPGFLTAMLSGIVLTNVADALKIRLNEPAINLASDVSLQLFLGLSLMSIQIWTLSNAMGPILFVLLGQVTVMTVFAIFVVLRVMGRDYDACVMSAGFAGLGLGATPVAIANMNAITEKYGPSPKAFLVIPLIGAFFIDVLNAVVIKFFAQLPMISNTPI